VTMLRRVIIHKERIRICKSKKNRQHNGQHKDKGTKNHLQNTTQKTKDQAKRNRLKTGHELRSSVRISSYYYPYPLYTMLCLISLLYGTSIDHSYNLFFRKQIESKMNRQHNGQQKDKGTKNHLQNTTQKTKDQAERNRLKTGDELRSSVRISSYRFTSATCHVAPVKNLTIHKKNLDVSQRRQCLRREYYGGSSGNISII
jgi:hypothetical protein